MGRVRHSGTKQLRIENSHIRQVIKYKYHSEKGPPFFVSVHIYNFKCELNFLGIIKTKIEVLSEYKATALCFVIFTVDFASRKYGSIEPDLRRA